jgi:D-beta-D-heptose 7-phosphate kinase/D-beta-D-heptose 1-phosphate adenosyltransferase
MSAKPARLEPSRVGEILEAMMGRNVLVVGDVMLDRYESGDVVRLSPEAPVPVLKKVEQRDVPGGAANVAMNVSALGGDVHLLGVVGEDEEAAVIKRILEANSVKCSLIADASRPTTLKTRFVHRSQQFLRLDRELPEPLPAGIVQSMVREFGPLAGRSGCVILSDYAKGLFSPVVADQLVTLADDAGVPVVVDPKPSNAYLCERCFVFMPNRGEGALIAGLGGLDESPGDEIAGLLVEKYGNNVLLTDGKNGMFVAITGSPVIHIESKASEVFDVSGAGDTAVAAVALAVATGMNLVDAACIANEAAGIAVSKLGTAVATPEEILVRAGGDNKVLDWERLKRAVDALKAAGRKVVFTNGCFDLLHVGHIEYLRAARETGDALVVALNTDESVRRLKGPERPLISERQRAELIAALESVDYVTLFGQDTPIELIELLQPDVFVKGGDYTEDMLPEAPVVKGYGGRVVIVPLYGGGISTTELIDRISGGGNRDE